MDAAQFEGSEFVAADYSARDLTTAPTWLTAMTDQTLEGVDAGVVGAPPVSIAVSAIRSLITGLDGERPDPVQVGNGVALVRELGRVLHDAGAGVATQEGIVAQINTSDGGVPKTAVASVDVGLRGPLGDRQANRKHHGRPFQALCLWSGDVIESLRGEGHPIRAGAAGENITVSGIDWASLRPGVRMLVGQVLCELSAWAVPCRNNDQWFTGRSDRIDHDLHPGWSRIYAWVLEPGTVVTGDPVIVEP